MVPAAWVSPLAPRQAEGRPCCLADQSTATAAFAADGYMVAGDVGKNRGTEKLVPGTSWRVCREQGKVAFGSRAWEVLRRFDEGAGPGAPVLIYASHPATSVGPVVTWRAIWAGWVESEGGAHPDGDLYRPPSTHGGEDRARWWAVFWAVSDLRELSRDEWLPVARLTDLRGRAYRRGFMPEGPILLGAAP